MTFAETDFMKHCMYSTPMENTFVSVSQTAEGQTPVVAGGQAPVVAGGQTPEAAEGQIPGAVSGLTLDKLGSVALRD